jgi:hypothetical protein
MCIDGQSPSIETWYNQRYVPSVLASNETSIGLTNTKVSYANGILSCSLSRAIAIDGLKNFYDLNNLYFLIVAKGPIDGNLIALYFILNS